MSTCNRVTAAAVSKLFVDLVPVIGLALVKITLIDLFIVTDAFQKITYDRMAEIAFLPSVKLQAFTLVIKQANLVNVSVCIERVQIFQSCDVVY